MSDLTLSGILTEFQANSRLILKYVDDRTPNVLSKYSTLETHPGYKTMFIVFVDRKMQNADHSDIESNIGNIVTVKVRPVVKGPRCTLILLEIQEQLGEK